MPLSLFLGVFSLERCVLVSARRYDFTDDAGKRVAGVSVEYVTGEAQEEQQARGLPVMTINAAPELWPELTALPGVYDVDFKQRPGAKGRPTLQIVSVNLAGALDFGKFLNTPSAVHGNG
jgi:hypothetical protein